MKYEDKPQLLLIDYELCKVNDDNLNIHLTILLDKQNFIKNV